MIYDRSLRPLWVLMAIAVFFPASAASAQQPRTDTGVVAGSADEMSQLIGNHELTALRAEHNADYSASLMFQTSKLSYYVALMYGNEFLKVIRTSSIDDAESIYRGFAAQTEQLAQVDIDTLRLQAGKKYAEHMVDINQQRLLSLQKDADTQKQQAQRVATLQQQAQQNAVALSGDLHQTSEQLDAVQKHIRALEADQANPLLTLPASSASTH